MKTYCSHYKKQFILGPLAKLAEAILELLVPLCMAKMIDFGIATGNISYIIKTGCVMILLGTAGLCFAIICQHSAAVAQQGVGTELRNDMFQKIQSLSAADFQNISKASLVTRITNDVNQIQSGVAMFIRLMFRSPFLIVGAFIAAMSLSLKMSIIFLVCGILVSLIMYYVLKHSLPLYKKMQSALDKTSLILNENLLGMRVIRAFTKQKEEQKRFENENARLTKIGLRVGKLNALLNPMTFAIINIGIVILLWFGGKNVYSGKLTQGTMIALVSYLTQIALSIIVFANVLVVYTKALASVVRVEEVLKLEPTITDKHAKGYAPDYSAPAIQFNNVTFSYPKAEEATLSHLSFTIEKGKTIGIIGGTGAGKSSCMHLLPRFYDADCGEVLVFGQNVKEYKFNVLRKIIHIVPQKNQLFTGTIRENLCLGDKNADSSAIRKALEISQSAEFVDSLPDGLDTQLEENSNNLSGGQKQRLCIARAILGNPDILILDDSSSALDFATDAKLRKAIHENLQDTTVLLVSQRVNTVKNADKILVLEDGKLVGTGTHQTLFETSDVYRDICLSQLSDKEVQAI